MSAYDKFTDFLYDMWYRSPVCWKILKYQSHFLVYCPSEYLITVRNEVAKVMFLPLSVILFTGGLPQCMLGWYLLDQTPPGPGTPPPTGPGTPPRYQAPPWDQASPQDQTPMDQAPPGTRHPPRTRHPPGPNPPHGPETLPRTRQPPREQTATAADGTHPTRMHSCFEMKSVAYLFWNEKWSWLFCVLIQHIFYQGGL